MATNWFVYIVRCQDLTLYTGITTDPAQRLTAHNSGTTGAKYTRSRRPVRLVYLEESPCRSTASKREYAIKRLTLSQKRALIARGQGVSLNRPPSTPCPCGSSHPYPSCCKPYLEEHKVAVTAEALMRSRYSAFALGKGAYLLQSWHPETAPATLVLETSPVWCGLEVLATQDGQESDDSGVVEFKAHYRSGGKSFTLHEVSRFVKEKGRWYYVEGDSQQAETQGKTGRNEPCPCGSDRKFKKCCGG
ncbi:MAG: YchJ family metal-binding protein [Desulfurivibrionaceae bacterium]|nr:YchJ family metal-binding protein [Desulfurivibrionaceae bacterium]